VDEAALVHHVEAIGQSEDLGKLGRHEQHRAARVALGQQPPMNRVDRAEIDPARRVRGEQHRRRARQLTRNDQLLLIAAGQLAGEALRLRRAHVVVVEHALRARAEPTRIEKRALAERRLAMPPENQILGQRHVDDESANQTIARDVRDAVACVFARRAPRQLAIGDA
jgi:hypothetical protein